MPSELYEGTEDFEERQVFVPARVPQPVPVPEDDHYQEWNQTFHSIYPGHDHGHNRVQTWGTRLQKQ